MTRALVLAAAVLYLMAEPAPEPAQVQCHTDTECMLMHGGNGGPEDPPTDGKQS